MLQRRIVITYVTRFVVAIPVKGKKNDAVFHSPFNLPSGNFRFTVPVKSQQWKRMAETGDRFSSPRIKISWKIITADQQVTRHRNGFGNGIFLAVHNACHQGTSRHTGRKQRIKRPAPISTLRNSVTCSNHGGGIRPSMTTRLFKPASLELRY